MDTLSIRGLQTAALIGVYDEERSGTQPIKIDLDYSLDITEAAQTDALDKTIDYAKLTARVDELISASSFQLIEALAEHVAQTLLKEYGISWLRLTLTKTPKDLANIDSVSITIERPLPLLQA